jgi:tetratricopeptide (TPR) repeat protein
VFSHIQVPAPGEAREAVERLLFALQDAFDRSLPSQLRPLLPHTRALAETATLERKGALLVTLGNLLQRLFDFPGAVTAYRAALEVRTRAELPQHWATTQNNLGTALQEQGIRTAGEAGARLLAEAVQAFEGALEVYREAGAGYYVQVVERNLQSARAALARLKPAGGTG